MSKKGQGQEQGECQMKHPVMLRKHYCSPGLLLSHRVPWCKIENRTPTGVSSSISSGCSVAQWLP